MTILIIGTPDSGKSEKAEALAMELAGSQKKYYIATMIPFGEEGAKRVEKHRKLREGKGFETIEKPLAVHELAKEISDIDGSTCLLECMSNLIGNEMHKEPGKQTKDSDIAEYITGSVMALSGTASNLVIVTNTFPIDDASYDADTREYTRLVERVNSKLKAKADRVYELYEGEWKLSENA